MFIKHHAFIIIVRLNLQSETSRYFKLWNWARNTQVVFIKTYARCKQWTHFQNAKKKKKRKRNTTQVNRWKNNWAPVHHKVISDCLYHQAVVIKREGRGKGKSHPAQPLSKLRETGQLFFRVKEPVIEKEETAGRIDTALLKPFCTSNLIKERWRVRETHGIAALRSL